MRMRHPLRSAGDLFGSKWFAIGWIVSLAAWVFHVRALSLAPLSTVQAVLFSAGLVCRDIEPGPWRATADDPERPTPNGRLDPAVGPLQAGATNTGLEVACSPTCHMAVRTISQH